MSWLEMEAARANLKAAEEIAHADAAAEGPAAVYQVPLHVSS